MQYPDLLNPNAGHLRDSVLENMRNNSPIYKVESPLDAWLVTRYKDIHSILRDDRFEFGAIRAEVEKRPPDVQEKLAPFVSAMDNLMSVLSIKEHKVLQQLHLEYLHWNTLDKYKDQIKSITTHQLEVIKNKKNPDLAEDYSYPIPTSVMATILGIPHEDHHKFIELSAPLSAVFLPYDYDRYCSAMDATLYLLDYFKKQMPIAMKEKPESMLAMFGNAVENCIISEDQALMSCVASIFAGHETTAKSLNFGIEILSRNPDVVSKVKNDSSLMPKLVEEITRFRPAVGWLRRTALEDIEYNGYSIKKNDIIFLCVYSGNRDSDYFPDKPNEFNIDRKNKGPSLTFGAGRHYCLGANLAKMELEIAFSTLIENWENLNIHTNRIKYTDTMLLMDDITSIPVTYSA